MGASGTVTNLTSVRLSFSLIIDYYDPNGYRFTQDEVTISGLPPGASEEWGSWLDRMTVTVDSDGSSGYSQAEMDAAGEGFTCEVTGG
jgi:hypothetical protein